MFQVFFGFTRLATNYLLDSIIRRPWHSWHPFPTSDIQGYSGAPVPGNVGNLFCIWRAVPWWKRLVVKPLMKLPNGLRTPSKMEATKRWWHLVRHCRVVMLMMAWIKMFQDVHRCAQICTVPVSLRRPVPSSPKLWESPALATQGSPWHVAIVHSEGVQLWICLDGTADKQWSLGTVRGICDSFLPQNGRGLLADSWGTRAILLFTFSCQHHSHSP